MTWLLLLNRKEVKNVYYCTKISVEQFNTSNMHIRSIITDLNLEMNSNHDFDITLFTTFVVDK